MMVFSSLGAQSCFEIDRRRRRTTTAATTTKQKLGITIPPKISRHTSLVFLGSGFNREPSRALESVIICDNLPEWKWQMKSLIISSFHHFIISSFQSFHQLGETIKGTQFFPPEFSPSRCQCVAIPESPGLFRSRSFSSSGTCCNQ